MPSGELHKAREYNELPDFEPKAHSLFKIHTHVTPQGFIFVNFDARETPAVSFEEQFGDDFEPMPTTQTGREIGDEFALFPNDGWEYDHTWNSSVGGTEFNWKTFVDGFQVSQAIDRCCPLLRELTIRDVGMLSLPNWPSDNLAERLRPGSVLSPSGTWSVATFPASEERRLV